MDYFWTYMPQIPENVGFGLYSTTHLVVSLFLIGLVVWIIQSYKNANQKGKNIRRLVVAGAIFGMEIFKDVFLLVDGHADWYLLPLHLCGMSIYVVAFDALYQLIMNRQNKTTSEIMYALTFPGAMAALLFPDWVAYPIANAWAWQSFLIHTLLVSYVLMQIASGDLVPQYRQLWRPALFVAAVVPPVMVVNHQLGTNFWFLNTAVSGSPLEILQTTFGPFYILSMIGMLLLVWGIFYWPWLLQNKKETTKKMVA